MIPDAQLRALHPDVQPGEDQTGPDGVHTTVGLLSLVRDMQDCKSLSMQRNACSHPRANAFQQLDKMHERTKNLGW